MAFSFKNLKNNLMDAYNKYKAEEPIRKKEELKRLKLEVEIEKERAKLRKFKKKDNYSNLTPPLKLDRGV